MNNKRFEIKSQNDNAEIYIYGEISSYENSSIDFIENIKLIGDVKNINIHLNSPGGSVIEGNAIYNVLKSHPAKINIYIESAAYSIASVIAMAGDYIEMSENALFMMHEPYMEISASADGMIKSAEVLEKITLGLISAYAKKTGKPELEISNMMKEETWLTAEEALSHGFIDSISNPIEVAACFDVSTFKNPPIQLKDNKMKNENAQSKDLIDFKNKENKRRNDIKQSFSPFSEAQGVPELLNSCLDNMNITEKEARNRLLDQLGKGVTPLARSPDLDYEHQISMSGDRSIEFKAAATDALMIRNGIKIKDPHPGSQDLSRMSILDMAKTVLSQQGRSKSGMSSTEILNAATHTNSDFTSILANTLGKSLMNGYMTEPTSHEIWTGSIDVRDFKEQSFTQLSEAPELLKVIEGGEYKYGTFGDKAETLAVSTYGRLFSISRQALINDDLSAFTRLPAAFGSSAKRKESDLVYNVITSNPLMNDGVALFDSAHGNLETGASLSVASLGQARKAMRIQKGMNGSAHLNIRPRYLIVPASLETTAEQLVSSLIDPSKSNDTPNLDFIRGLELVVDARLDADSETAWYLAADTNQVDTVVRAYLDGQPFSFEEKAGWEVDGVEFKTRTDVGVKALEWVGLLKNPGV